jgi:hypothetical protein
MNLDFCDDSPLIGLLSFYKSISWPILSISFFYITDFTNLQSSLAWRAQVAIKLSSSIHTFALTFDNSRYRPTVSTLRSPTSSRTNENRPNLVIHAVMTNLILIKSRITNCSLAPHYPITPNSTRHSRNSSSTRSLSPLPSPLYSSLASSLCGIIHSFGSFQDVRGDDLAVD